MQLICSGHQMSRRTAPPGAPSGQYAANGGVAAVALTGILVTHSMVPMGLMEAPLIGRGTRSAGGGIARLLRPCLAVAVLASPVPGASVLRIDWPGYRMPSRERTRVSLRGLKPLPAGAPHAPKNADAADENKDGEAGTHFRTGSAMNRGSAGTEMPIV
jgi:hypothetical protein